MSTPVFSNKPRFCQKTMTTGEILSLPKFNAMVEGSTTASSALNFGEACGDPNLGTLAIKNVIHEAIRCGNSPIDLNWLMDLFGGDDRLRVATKDFYNHYICDVNMNVYVAAAAKATAPGGAVTFQLLRNNHGTGGNYSPLQPGFQLWDKENMIEMTVASPINTTTPYAHRITVYPNDATVTLDLKPNKEYLVIPARRVGGNSCKIVTNSVGSIGYSQKVNFLRLRRDWEVEIDLLRGNVDKFQFGVIYNSQGEPMDAWDVLQAQEARLALRMALNIAAFIGTPTTNSTLLAGMNAVVDQYYPGFYGILPSIKYGNGIVYDYRKSVGFDFETDGEPLMLYQDSQKGNTKFLLMHGLGFAFGSNNRATKMVARTDVGASMWDAYRRLGGLNGNYETEMAKLGISRYVYEGFEYDKKLIKAMSDRRFMGSDYFSNLAIMMPQDGATENGQPVDPIEFFNQGQNGWTGDFEEIFTDNRYQTAACETIQGHVAQSIAMAMHCPDKWALLNPVEDAA